MCQGENRRTERGEIRLEQNLEQLSYLNFTSYELVQIVDIEQLYTVIGTAFTARFPHAHLSICHKKKGRLPAFMQPAA